MIFSSQEREDLYRALAIVEEVVIDNVEMWAQRLHNYKVWIEYEDEDEVKIVVDEVPKSMTMLQALHLAEKLIAAVLEADKMKKLKKWLEE
jgi:uncharacterized membrane protein